MLSTLFLILTNKKRQKENKNKNFYLEKGGLIKKVIKGSLYEKVNKFVKETGYIVSIEKYILVHVLLFIFIIISLFQIIFIGFKAIGAVYRIMALILLFNYILHLIAKKRKEKLLVELTKVQGVMYFQNRIGVPDDVVIVNASYIAKEPLKKPLEDLAAAFRFKKDIDKALDEFRNISDLQELKTFSFILGQKQKTGKSEESHKAQNSMLRRNRRLRRKIERHNKRLKLILAAFLLFSCYVMLTAGPLIRQVIRTWSMMFK
ncbi:MAG: tight adherence protein [Candidatus Petromonas sp.]|nr:tight adherence protein [Candidatus Petromonas sp.]